MTTLLSVSTAGKQRCQCNGCNLPVIAGNYTRQIPGVKKTMNMHWTSVSVYVFMYIPENQIYCYVGMKDN